MNKREEQIYVEGTNQAYVTMLSVCLKNLGIDHPEAQHAVWIAERQAVVAVLRTLCEEFGDNDWDDNLHLADVIKKHLSNHLRSFCIVQPDKKNKIHPCHECGNLFSVTQLNQYGICDDCK
jgi:hypothetical protein